MPAIRLNVRLLQRMSDKTGKPVQYIREQVSKRARRLDIPSTAAQLIWAKQLGIGVTSALARAAPEVRQEVRTVGTPRPERAPSPRRPSPRNHRKSAVINDQTVRALIRDQQLYGRCKDYLTQSGWMRVAQLYESPFTDFSPRGIEGVFTQEQVVQVVSILSKIQRNAAVNPLGD